MVEEFEIKLATIEDEKDIFDLSNDDLVRANSFNQNKIKWEDHKNWFRTKLNDDNCIFYVVRNNDNLVAQIRFDKSEQETKISISISPSFRGRGIGVNLLKESSQKVIKEEKIKKIVAYVKNENVASKNIFEKAGYILKEENPEKRRYEYNAK